jgi:hypothetical protein
MSMAFASCFTGQLSANRTAKGAAIGKAPAFYEKHSQMHQSRVLAFLTDRDVEAIGRTRHSHQK